MTRFEKLIKLSDILTGTGLTLGIIGILMLIICITINDILTFIAIALIVLGMILDMIGNEVYEEAFIDKHPI